MSGYVLRLIWPITDPTCSWHDLLATACPDIPGLARQAHAVPIGQPRFHVARSQDVPGSGNTTPTVLVAELPARPAAVRPYHPQEA